jgi:hypothetical protein
MSIIQYYDYYKQFKHLFLPCETKTFKSYKIRLFETATIPEFSAILIRQAHPPVIENEIFIPYFKIKYPKYDFYFLKLSRSNKRIKFTDIIKNFNTCMIFELSIVLIQRRHANILFYNNITQTLERYDPHGGWAEEYHQRNNSTKTILKFFKSQNIPVKHYKPVLMTCPIMGIQDKEKVTRIGPFKLGEKVNNIVNLGGYCKFWSYLMIEMKLNNPNSTIFELELILPEFVKYYNTTLTEYIQNYFLFINSLIFKICNFAMKVNSNLLFLDYLKNEKILKCIYFKKCLKGLKTIYSNPEKYLYEVYNPELIEFFEVPYNKKINFTYVKLIYSDQIKYLPLFEINK